MEVIFWRPEGPRIAYDEGTLYIDDLNHERHMRWAVSRRELITIGFKLIWTALRL